MFALVGKFYRKIAGWFIEMWDRFIGDSQGHYAWV